MRKAVVAGAVAVGAALVLVLSTGDGAGTARKAGEPAATDVAATAQAERASPPSLTQAAPSVAPEATGTTGGDDPRFAQRAERVSQAIALLRYAPGSRPLTPSMRDVLQPNRRHETAHPLSFATGSGGSRSPTDAPRPGELSYELTGNVYTVLPGASLDATLEVFRTGASGARERIAVSVTDLGIRLVEANGDRPVSASLAMNDAGDHVYALHFTPSATGGLERHRGLLRLDVGFVASEGDQTPARASLDFRVAGTVPATFAGVSGERLTRDGLEIAVDVDVTEPGRYFVQGLLFDAKHAPIGFAVARPTLAVGHATVSLTYFGLLFREANADGPYSFETVTGQRMPEGNEADRADMAPWAGPYRTKAYAAADFSDQEYESAGKDAKMQALSDLAAASPGHAKGSPAR